MDSTPGTKNNKDPREIAGPFLRPRIAAAPGRNPYPPRRHHIRHRPLGVSTDIKRPWHFSAVGGRLPIRSRNQPQRQRHSRPAILGGGLAVKANAEGRRAGI